MVIEFVGETGVRCWSESYKIEEIKRTKTEKAFGNIQAAAVTIRAQEY